MYVADAGECFSPTSVAGVAASFVYLRLPDCRYSHVCWCTGRAFPLNALGVSQQIYSFIIDFHQN